MKFGLFISYYKNHTKTETWKLVPDPLCLKTSKHNLFWKMKFLKQATYIRYVFMICKAIKIYSNRNAVILWFFFTEDSLKIKKGLELLSRSHFSQNFLIKIFLLQYYINWPNFITRLCLLPKSFSEICFVFHAWEYDDVMTFEYLKI